jgi:hypothetical protein
MLLRRGLAPGLLLLGAVVAACGMAGGANGFSEGPPNDGGADTSTAFDSGLGNEDTGTAPDAPSSTDGGNPDASPPATPLIFVHASPSLQSVRLCFSGGGEGALPFPSDNEMPASNYPGIPTGGAVWMTDVSAIPFAGTAYAVRAKNIAGSTAVCQDLLCMPGLGQNCLTQGLDYWPVGTITRSAALPGTTTVFAIAGCLGIQADSLATEERCGPDWNAATGNLHLDVVPVPPTATVDGGLVAQATQLSPGLVSLQGDAGTTSLSFGSVVDAQAVAQLGAEGTVVPIFMPLALAPGLATYGQVGFGVAVQDADTGSAGQVWMSLAQAQELVDPAQDPTVYYAQGQVVVAVLGDPSAPHAFADGDGGYDGKGLHLLVLPATAGMP